MAKPIANGYRVFLNIEEDYDESFSNVGRVQITDFAGISLKEEFNAGDYTIVDIYTNALRALGFHPQAIIDGYQEVIEALESELRNS